MNNTKLQLNGYLLNIQMRLANVWQYKKKCIFFIILQGAIQLEENKKWTKGLLLLRDPTVITIPKSGQ
jgi:hypothetical protein